MKTLAAVVVLLFVAGCSDNSARDPDGLASDTGSETADEGTETDCNGCQDAVTKPSGGPTFVQLFGCTVFLATFAVATSQLADELPTGYEPPSDGLVAQTIGLDTWMCERAVVDNTSVDPQVSFFTVSGLVQAPQERAHPDLDDFYVYEFVCDSDIVRAAFATINITILPGSASFAMMDPLGNLLYQQEAASYEFHLAGDMARSGNPGDDQVRFHQGASYYDGRSEGTVSTFENGGVVQVQGGVLSRLLPPPGLMTPAASASGTVDLTFQLYAPGETP